MKVVIIGGVAGGASAAARLRRNDEHAEIIMFERGDYISFANCGLPYYIGGKINGSEKLTLQTPESFHSRFNIDVRIRSEAVSIDRENKTVKIKKIDDGTFYDESYDKLILSPGAEPIRPNLPGADNEKVFTLRNIPDTIKIKKFCDENKPKRAVVIGGGYIGVEMAENLKNLGVDVTIVEMAGHIIGPIDDDMAAQVQNYIRSKGVSIILGQSVSAIEEAGSSLRISLSGGGDFETDFVIMSVGVHPESALAVKAGLKTNGRGCIIVDERMRTDDENIYAVGDACEVKDFVSGEPAFIPLASPANKQGHIAADNICGKDEAYEATQGSSIIKIFDMTVAATGLSEASLKRKNIKYLKSFTYSQANASYYPGGLPMSIKLLFTQEGKILGAQAAGYNGVDKRIDVIAAATRLGGTVHDLTKLELCYAPPYSSAKDPVNMAGYTASNILDGMMKPFYAEDIKNIDTEKETLLDVRTEIEFNNGTLPGAINIPVDNLRGSLDKIPKDKPIKVFCQIGLRGYIASRILMQSGFSDVSNLSGGFRLWKEIENNHEESKKAPLVTDAGRVPQAPIVPNDCRSVKPENTPKEITVDACGLSCPGPIMAVHKAMKDANENEVYVVKATDPGFSEDIKSWCSRTGNTLVDSGFDGTNFTAKIKKGSSEQVERTSMNNAANEKSIIVFSGDLDKAIASFIIANGAAAMGRKVNMFFTFWGLNVIRKPEKVKVKKDVMGAMFGKMMPRGSKRLGLSKMNMGGMGAKLIRGVMKKNNISSLEQLVEQARSNGVHFVACSMSMDVMGIKREELIDGIEVGGVASFLANAENSDMSLFI